MTLTASLLLDLVLLGLLVVFFLVGYQRGLILTLCSLSCPLPGAGIWPPTPPRAFRPGWGRRYPALWPAPCCFWRGSWWSRSSGSPSAMR